MHPSKKKSHMNWTWTLIISFFLLSVVNVYFGLLGFLCMLKPLYHGIRGQGKYHCTHHCPRGSFFGNFLKRMSQGKDLPGFMKTKWFKHLLLGLMVVMFSFSLYHAGGNVYQTAFAVFRFMAVSTVVGLLLGIFYKPRSWCVVCPMGHATGLLTKMKGKKGDNRAA